MTVQVGAPRPVDRVCLPERIPLPHPLTLFIDTLNACNFQCKFCPTGDRDLVRSADRKVTRMSDALFAKIVRDLARYDGQIATIYLYKDGEPLLNADLPRFIRMLRDARVCRQIAIITNGSLLTSALSEELIASGLDKITISVECMSSEGYRDFAKYDLDWDRFVENIRYLHRIRNGCQVNIKVNADLLDDEGQAAFLSTFGPYAHNAYLEHTVDCWPGFAPKVPVNEATGVFGQAQQAAVVCPYIFYSLAINASGLVSLCCADWRGDLIVGDVATQAFHEIWTGEALRAHQLRHLSGQRHTDPTCGRCGHPNNCAVDNIDEHALVLLRKLSA